MSTSPKNTSLNKDAFLNQINHENLHFHTIPNFGTPGITVKKIIDNKKQLDFAPTLNTSSYVQVDFDPIEDDLLTDSAMINIADQTIYPHAFQIHDECVSMIARLWHCPEPNDGVFAGAGTVGSTEACLLAALALKFRWRAWYAQKHQLSAHELLAIKPNLIISSCFQAAWEKVFRYLDIEPRIITVDHNQWTLDPEQLDALVDEQTIGVVAIMGNHYSGHFDPVHEIDHALNSINQRKKLDVGIHVDAASGGFVAPFLDGVPEWDFRLKHVLSISSSGHKYGEARIGTGWIIWRHRESLSEYVSVNVSYLGGHADSYTLNFSRPASGVFSQYYKLLHFGRAGYQAMAESTMANAMYLRKALLSLMHQDKPRFLCLDQGGTLGLPVVAMRLNPECHLNYNDIDLQNILSKNHWYVSGYQMQFEHPLSQMLSPLLSDASMEDSMFRVVIKSHLTQPMLDDLIAAFKDALAFLDHHGSLIDSTMIKSYKRKVRTNHC